MGVGGSCGRRMRSSIETLTSSIGMATTKRSDNWWRARICSLPIVLNDDTGAGLFSTFASILAAAAALLTDNVVGMKMWRGKN